MQKKYTSTPSKARVVKVGDIVTIKQIVYSEREKLQVNSFKERFVGYRTTKCKVLFIYTKSADLTHELAVIKSKGEQPFTVGRTFKLSGANFYLALTKK
jgi:hypothetical protein